MPTIRIERVTTHHEDVEMPETCPGCGAGFTGAEDSALMLYELVERCGFGNLVDDGVSWKEGDEKVPAGAAEASPTDLACQRCAWQWSLHGTEAPPRPRATAHEVLESQVRHQTEGG